MKRLFFLISIIALFSLSGCGLHKPYTSDYQMPEQVMGNGVVESDTNIAELSWREIFTDPQLQSLIDEALANNPDLQSSHLRVQEMEYALAASKLAFFPSVSLAPNASFNYLPNPNSHAFSYGLPINVSWQVDIFGSLTNKKRETEALYEQMRDFEQAARAELIANTASLYYQLLMLDRQLQVVRETEVLWQKSIDTQQAFVDAGIGHTGSVSQLTASLYNIQAQAIDIERTIRAYENALCLLLSEPSHNIQRGKLDDFQLPEMIGVGVSASLLQNRPDVRAAQRGVEAAYYVNKQAVSDLYPKLTLGGLAGWGNGVSGISLDPAQIILNAVGQLAQPIFANGQLRANVKITQAQQEEAKLAFAKSVLQAGNDVNNAIATCQSSKDKKGILENRVKALGNAYYASNELLAQGQGTFLEVLMAQESLLDAQLDQVNNAFDAVQGLIDLYLALGGGK